MAQHLYDLLKTTKPDSIFLEDTDDMTFQILKESLINSPALGHSIYQLSSFLFCI